MNMPRPALGIQHSGSEELSPKLAAAIFSLTEHAKRVKYTGVGFIRIVFGQGGTRDAVPYLETPIEH